MNEKKRQEFIEELSSGKPGKLTLEFNNMVDDEAVVAVNLIHNLKSRGVLISAFADKIAEEDTPHARFIESLTKFVMMRRLESTKGEATAIESLLLDIIFYDPKYRKMLDKLILTDLEPKFIAELISSKYYADLQMQQS